MPRSPTHPLVVVDLNVLKDERLSEFVAPKGWSLLIPDIAFTEAADQVKAVEAIESIFGFCINQPCPIWLGKDRDLLFHSPDRKVRLLDLVHGHPINRHRGELLRALDSWREKLIAFRGSEEHEKYVQSGQWFVELTAEYREYFNQNHPALRDDLDSPAWVREMVQDPALVAGPVLKFRQEIEAAQLPLKRMQRRRLPLFRKTLERFPDSLPLARWMRIVARYAIMRANLEPGSKTDRRFPNNFDDSFYALAASYTGHLLTNDSGLRDVAAMIAPGIRLWRWIEGRIEQAS